MNLRFLSLALGVALATPALFAQPAAPAAAEKSPADQAFEAVIAKSRQQPVDQVAVMNAAFDFSSEFASDPRSTRILMGLEGFDGRMDDAGKAAYAKAFDERLAAAMAAPGISVERREALAALAVNRAMVVERRSDAPNARAVRAKIDAFVQEFPKARAVSGMEMGYVAMLEKSDKAAAEAHLRKLAASGDETLAQQAGGELRVMEMRTKPVEMKFTAADGREVDLAKLRGKVVLIDFWATWCGPCIAELPNLTRVYNEYHDKGFEIVGISFENSRVAEGDTEEAQATKHAAAKEKMLKFAAEKDMPWPQYYDGKYWANEYGRMYNIRGIPAMFLLDKDGKLVETNARGEKLEPLVKQLLGV